MENVQSFVINVQNSLISFIYDYIQFSHHIPQLDFELSHFNWILAQYSKFLSKGPYAT